MQATVRARSSGLRPRRSSTLTCSKRSATHPAPAPTCTRRGRPCSSATSSTAVRIGDLNRAGAPDLAVVGQGPNRVYFGDGAGGSFLRLQTKSVRVCPGDTVFVGNAFGAFELAGELEVLKVALRYRLTHGRLAADRIGTDGQAAHVLHTTGHDHVRMTGSDEAVSQ